MRVYTGPAEDPITWPEHLPLSEIQRCSEPSQASALLYPWYLQDFKGWINPNQVDPSDSSLLSQLQNRLQHLVHLAEKYNKPLLLFEYSDTNTPVPCRQAWIWRTSLDARTRQPLEWSLPAFHADTGFEPLSLNPLPSVGFCGQAFPLQQSLRQRVTERTRELMRRPLPSPLGYRLRRNAMRSCLRAGRRLRCGFLLTDPADPLPKTQQRQRFLANLHGHAYVLCGSGYGNYSYRFYEALSAGRIPVLLNSHCVLPFAEEIPWRELVVWLPPHQINEAAERITAFHSRFNDESFAAHQRRLREVWETSCCSRGFQQHLSRWLQVRLP